MPLPLYIKNFSLSWGNALPRAGGLFDQDARLMNQIEACLFIYRAVQKRTSFDHKTIEEMSDAEHNLIASLQKEGVMDEVWAALKQNRRGIGG